MNKNTAAGNIYALLATALWSVNFIIARGLSSEIDAVTLAFLRWSLAFIIIFPFTVKSILKNINYIKKNILYISILSILGISLFNTLIYIAGHSTTAMNLSLISITFPIYLILISRFILKEKIEAKKIIGISFVFAGALFLISKGNLETIIRLKPAIGDLYMSAAAMIFAVYSLLLRKKPEGLDILTFQSCQISIGLLFLLPAFLFELAVKPFPQMSAGIIFSILYVGIFASLVSFILWNKAVVYIGAVKSGQIYLLLPLFGGILAFIFLGEKIEFFHFISILLITTGMLITNIKIKKKQPGI